MEFVLARLIFTLRLDRDVADPFALFTIRSSFRDVFRSTVCRRQGDCLVCGETELCPFHHGFSQELSSDRLAVRRHQKPPLPFAFDLDPLPGTPNRGKEIQIGLNLAGSAITYARYYIEAVCNLFREASSAGTFPGAVTRVESETCAGFRNSIMDGGGKPAYDSVSTISAADLAETRTLDQNRVRLTIATPMRLLRDGKPVRSFSFAPFAMSLLRRISSLAYHYYGGAPDCDYGFLSSSSASIGVPEDGFRWTRWGDERSGEWLGGITGSGVCEGMLVDFHPFLLVGEYFHVGKGSSYGLGRYRIDAVT